MNSALLTDFDFPAAYLAADKASLDGQRRFLNATKFRLISVMGAAVFGALMTFEDLSQLAAALAAASFGLAFIAEMYLLRTRPDRSWYDGRAGAESAKTLTWRFVVGGRPFGKNDHSDLEAEKLLLDRLHDVVGSLKSVPIVAPAPSGTQSTDAMRSLRARSLDERREAYLESRIRDQQVWYSAKASENEKKAREWMMLLGILEAAALIAAILMAADVLSLNFLGIAATAVGVGAAWTQTKQFQILAAAYAVASQELAEIQSRGASGVAEADWAEFVEQSEEAISREHTLWRASRGS